MELLGIDRGSGRPGVARPLAGRPEVDAAEDQGQVGGRDLDSGGGGRWKLEGAALEPAHIQGEPVTLPGEDLELVAAAVLENEQVAAQWISRQVGGDDGREPVIALAAVDLG